MAQFRVDLQQLSTTVETLFELSERYANRIAKLEELEGMLVQMWEGEARDAFHEAFASDIQQMYNFKALAVRFAELLAEIQARYADAEARNIDIARTRTYA